MAKKKIKVKVKKRKINIRRILIVLLIIVLISLMLYYFTKLQIKNIYIVGNEILSDKEIIEIAKLDNYPTFISTNSSEIEKKLSENVYMKEVKVKKKLYSKIYIYITEKKILCTYDNNIILEDSSVIQNNYKIMNVPILLSDIANIKEKFVTQFSLIEESILLKISEIEYSPNEVDDERFSLRMNDGNLVYITLNKIEKMNKYNSIYSSLEGKRGIIYLDSGDYVELKEE